MAISGKRLVQLTQAIMPDVGTAARRFPVAVLIALIFTALHLFDVNKVLEFERLAWMRLSAALCTAFFWSVSASLYSEARRSSPLVRFTLEAGGLALIAALSFFHQPTLFYPPLFLGAAAIQTGFSPYLARGAANAAFWQFNHRLWLGAALAVASAVLLSGGISLIIETLELLFELKISGVTHGKVWTVGLGLVGPLNWLTLAPVDFTEKVPEGEQGEFTSRAVAVIVKYILVPLLLIYTAILYAYAAKIALDGVFPRGRVGPIVLSYGLLGTLTVLFAWPSRKAGGPLVALFWRHWFWLTLGPATLLFLAAYKRITQYGVTEERYLVVLAGVWLCAMALWFVARRGARDIRIIPLSLCALLLIASHGPWGAIGLSVRSQKAELVNLLEANGRMKDGQIILTDENNPLPYDMARRAHSILLYLKRHERLEDLKSWFANVQENPFSNGVTQNQMTRKIARLIGVPKKLGPLRKPDHFYFAVQRPTLMPLSGFHEVIGPVTIIGSKPNITLRAADGTAMDVGIEKNIVTFRFPSGPELKFDVADAARRAAELRRRGAPPESANDPRVPLKVSVQNGGRSVMLIVEMRGKAGEVDADLQSLKVWLMLKRK